MATVLIPKTTLARTGKVQQQWFLVDAAGLVLGRLASDLAVVLMGKHKPIYTPHVDTGDFVVVINASKIRITGKKLDQEVHDYYTHYPSGRKETPWREMLEKRPEKLLELAVKRMLPKNKLASKMFSKLKVYRDAEHPHQAQKVVELDLSKGLPAALEKMAGRAS